MTKSETRETEKLAALARIAGSEHLAYLARGFSALARSARTTKSKNEILTAAACKPAIVQHPDFIV